MRKKENEKGRITHHPLKLCFWRSKSSAVSYGSALIMALVSLTVLVLLGLAVATLSMGSLVSNSADAQTNTAYYAAESSINSALDQLKYEALKYYNEMLDADGSAYQTLYNNFFSTINSSAQLNFTDPAIDGVTTDTTFTMGDYDAGQNVGEFLISCDATAADGTSYVVNGTLYIKRLDLSSAQNNWLTGDAALKAGGTLNLGSTDGITVSGGNAIVAELVHSRQWGLPYTISGGQLIISPDIGDTINDVLTYPSYSDPVMDSVNLYITQNNYTINWSNVPPEPVGITTAPGINIYFSSCTVPNGTIYGKGDVHITNGTYYTDVYCDGDFYATSCTIRGDLYCRGDAHIDNLNMYGTIYCDGAVILHNGSYRGTIYAGESINIHDASSTGSMFSPGPISITSSGISNGIVYSSTKINMGNMSANAVFFSGGDIEVTNSMSLNGAVYAKGDIYYTSDSWNHLTVNYSDQYIDNIVADADNEFFFSGPGEPQLDEDVFLDQSVTAQGRGN